MFDLSFAEYTRQQKQKNPYYIRYKQRIAAEEAAKKAVMSGKLKLLADLKSAAAAYVSARAPTKAELVVAEELGKLSIFYKREHPVVINNGKGNYKLYIMDFYLYEQNICLEVDGGYHTLAEQRQYDAQRDRRIACPTIRIPNEAVLAPGFSLLDWL